jgi:isoleucyl-tRNA synthetase
MARYRPVDARVDLPAVEREILEFWRETDVFAKSLALRKGSPEWVFYEGPPTANGKPGIHHVEARTFKDIYPRYKTMTGHYVHRKAGWDCHGLPVELEIEKEIGTKSKRDIEAFGVAEFNRLCRESVTRYVGDFQRLTERIGFWLDFDDAYWTMSPEYIQSVWWALKELHGKGLLYQDDKVTAYCPRCGTPLADHEVAMGYAQVTDPSIFVRFPVTEGPPEAEGASLLVWTTTPWTLISNTGAAVAPDQEYVRVRTDQEDLILAAALRAVAGEDAPTVATFPGKALEGTRYRPPFPNVEGAHAVVTADWVAMDEGTGIVHMAPAFGTEDMEVGRSRGWPVFKPVDDEGKFTHLAPGFVRGLFVKAADPLIIDDLRARGLLLRAEEIEHTYPLCWRCDTPLIYYARPAWYVRTTAFKARLLDANEKVNWYPEHIKHGRYGDWLANNVDWSLSRDRYWGTPLPIWICPDGHQTVAASLSELSDLAGRDLTGMDPHKPAIDEVSFACPSCGRKAVRVPYLIDVWFDAGAMQFAQWSYGGPGSGSEEDFKRRFPADFIAEGVDQTRGWFYTLMAEGVLLFGESPYRNVLCLGLLLGRDGRRMSTRLGTALDPWAVIDRFGADALRWFLIAGGSPWSARRVYLEVIEDAVRQVLLTLRNTHAFYVTYANLDQPDLAAAPVPAGRQPLDRWALSQLHGTIAFVREAMEAYDATGAARRIAEFLDDLSNWYVRRSRRRFWDPERDASRSAAGGAGKLAAYATLYECLATVAGLLAPFVPFVSEALYRNLVAEQDPHAPVSVHLTDFPVAVPAMIDPALDEAMRTVRSLVSLGRQVRTDAKVRVRQPVGRAVVHVSGDPTRLEALMPLVAEELNVKEVQFAESAEQLAGWRAKPNFRALGPRLGSRVQEVAAALAAEDGTLARRLAAGQPVEVPLPGDPVTLGPEDVELTQEIRAGWGLASGGTETVALDLELSPELRREGVARELIHHVQNLRKSTGLDVADRIVLGVEADAGAAQAIQEHRARIAADVLAVDVRGASLDAAEGAADVHIDGLRVRLSLRRAEVARGSSGPGL